MNLPICIIQEDVGEYVLSEEADPQTTIQAKSNHSSHIFSKNVFNYSLMQTYLPDFVRQAIVNVVLNKEPLAYEYFQYYIDAVTHWASAQGVTHYSFWLQPLTSKATGKYNSFFNQGFAEYHKPITQLNHVVFRCPKAQGKAASFIFLKKFKRGYLQWDFATQPFIISTDYGKTLYLPTCYLNHKHEALDNKLPLQKATHALNQAATQVCKYFDNAVESVQVNLGWEQEFFLIDKKVYNARPDLQRCGRTLIGAAPPCGQEKEDHYCGPIPTRVQNFIQACEQAGFALGIPLITHHNEFAPSLFECTAQYEEVNAAVEHNLLFMEIMKKIADEQDLVVIFHEKPFLGFDSSGKHNNWSLVTDTGEYLLTPDDSLQFYVFFINTLAAMAKHEKLLRASVADANNDLRLGAYDSPPAIISSFIGSYLYDVLINFQADKNYLLSLLETPKPEPVGVGLSTLPKIVFDKTDRNRTSSFPFVNNRFEFRCVGAEASCAPAMIVLNTIVADQLTQFKTEVDSLIQNGTNTQDAILTILQSYLPVALKVVHNGSNHTEAWRMEAKQRGLSYIKTTPEAIEALLAPETITLCERQAVLSYQELYARYQTILLDYIYTVENEANTLQDICSHQIIPSAFRYISDLQTLQNNLYQMELEAEAKELNPMIEKIQNLINELKNLIHQLSQNIQHISIEADKKIVANFLAETVRPSMDKVRAVVDRLELLLPADYWNLTRYREILFNH